MFGLSFWEITLILAVALLVLGPKRLPGLAKSVGKGLRELRRASTDLRSAIEEPLEEVRKPLEDIRDDLVDTVHGFEEEVEREAGQEEAQEEAHNPYDDPQPGDDDEDNLEVDDRRREVEEMYSRAGQDEGADDRGVADLEIADVEVEESAEKPDLKPDPDEVSTKAPGSKA